MWYPTKKRCRHFSPADALVPQDPFLNLYLKHTASKPSEDIPAPSPTARVSESWEDYIQGHAQQDREEYIAWIESEVDEFRVFNLFPRTPEERVEWMELRMASYLVPARTQLEARFTRQRDRLERTGATPDQLLRFERKCAKERKEFESSALRKLATWREDLFPHWEIVPATTEDQLRDRFIG